MKPTLLHRICARPFAICWTLGTLFLWILVTIALHDEGVFPLAFTDIQSAVLLLIGYACLAGIGLYVGAIPSFWLVARICRRINGAPFTVGERVTILVGRHAGTTTTVYRLTRGQGGDLMPVVDLGTDIRAQYLDIFDDFALLRTKEETAAVIRPKQGAST